MHSSLSTRILGVELLKKILKLSVSLDFAFATSRLGIEVATPAYDTVQYSLSVITDGS
jgi:hypothetical protein